MKPKPFVSLNHLTVPVVRIAELLMMLVVGVLSYRTYRLHVERERRPHAEARPTDHGTVSWSRRRGRKKRDPRVRAPDPWNSTPGPKHGGASLRSKISDAGHRR